MQKPATTDVTLYFKGHVCRDNDGGHVCIELTPDGCNCFHAGAIIEGNRGTHAGKVQALRGAGAVVVDGFGDLPDAVIDTLTRQGISITAGVA